METLQVIWKFGRKSQKGSALDAFNAAQDRLINNIEERYEKWLRTLISKTLNTPIDNIDIFKQIGNIVRVEYEGLKKNIYIKGINVGSWSTNYNFAFENDKITCSLDYWPVFDGNVDDNNIYIPPQNYEVGEYLARVTKDSFINLSLTSGVIVDKIDSSIDILNKVKENLKNITISDLSKGLDKLETNIDDCISQLKDLQFESIYRDRKENQ